MHSVDAMTTHELLVSYQGHGRYDAAPECWTFEILGRLSASVLISGLDVQDVCACVLNRPCGYSHAFGRAQEGNVPKAKLLDGALSAAPTTIISCGADHMLPVLHRMIPRPQSGVADLHSPFTLERRLVPCLNMPLF